MLTVIYWNWLNKPDGGEGWASFFLSQGYECYIIDQTFRGRSTWFPGNGTLGTYSAELLQQRFTTPLLYMEPLAPGIPAHLMEWDRRHGRPNL